MLRVTLTADTRQELDSARSLLSRLFVINREKHPETGEKQRHRLYLFVIPKDRSGAETGEKPLKNVAEKPGKD